MSDKQSLIFQTCLFVLYHKLPYFFNELSYLQLTSALQILTSASKSNDAIAQHSKVWEELIHPFKLLVECEKQYYEFGFLPSCGIGGMEYNPASAAAAQVQTSAGASSANNSLTSATLVPPPLSQSDSRKSSSSSSKSSSVNSNTSSNNEDHVKYMYSQIPVGLRKTMQMLQKLMQVQTIMNQQNAMHQQQQQSQHHHSQSHSVATTPRNSVSPTNNKQSSTSSPSDPIHVYQHLYHLFDELINGYIVLKITLIQFYQNMNAPYSSTSSTALTSSNSSSNHHRHPSSSSSYPHQPHIRDMNWYEHVRLCRKLRLKCERAFLHEYMILLKTSLLLPELWLLENIGLVECDIILPNYKFTSTMFLLMRIKKELMTWMNRLLARDREMSSGGGMNTSTAHSIPLLGGLRGSGGSSNKHSLPSTTGGGSHTAAHKYPLSNLSFSCNTVTFPVLLHWVSILHQSLVCKSTLLFWSILSLKNSEIKGYEAEVFSRMERLESGNYIAWIEKLMKRQNNAYSVSLVMDCSATSGGGASGSNSPGHNSPDHTGDQPDGMKIIDPLVPLHLTDSLQSNFTSTSGNSTTDTSSDSTPSSTSGGGGLASFPILFQYPPQRPILEKWNLVATLIAKQELMNQMSGGSGTSGNSSQAQLLASTLLKQTSTYIMSIGPSNLLSDLLIWDYENEFLRSSSGASAPNSISYFFAKVDLQKNLYLVVTFVANPTEVSTNPAAAPSVLAGSTAAGQNASGAAATAVSAVGIDALSRKRAFDHLLSDVVPLLQRLRHQHVFQLLQPSLGKKQS